jgi:DNA-binding transcriptional LysR family regulator
MRMHGCVSLAYGTLAESESESVKTLTGSWLPKVLQRLSHQYPKVEVELEIGVGSRLFKMVETEELDLAVGGICHAPAAGRRLWSEPLVWACSADSTCSADVEVPKVLPLAFFPEPCPCRDAALRALAGSQRQWRIISTASSLAGVQAAAMAGWAITPLPPQTLKPGLRILDKKDEMPRLPQVEYVFSRGTWILGRRSQRWEPSFRNGRASHHRWCREEEALTSTSATAR